MRERERVLTNFKGPKQELTFKSKLFLRTLTYLLGLIKSGTRVLFIFRPCAVSTLKPGITYFSGHREATQPTREHNIDIPPNMLTNPAGMKQHYISFGVMFWPPDKHKSHTRSPFRFAFGLFQLPKEMWHFSR